MTRRPGKISGEEEKAVNSGHYILSAMAKARAHTLLGPT
jgi:hypothetical protein